MVCKQNSSGGFLVSQKRQKIKRKVYSKIIGLYCESDIAKTIEKKLKKQKYLIIIQFIIITMFIIGAILCLILG
jgi:hypothetical protein